MTAPPVRVAYIAGARHCGSTMLDAVLGNAPGARSLGEVLGFLRYRDGKQCDCGRPAAACEPCSAVVEALAHGDDDAVSSRLALSPLKERRAHWALLATGGRRRYARASDVVLDTIASVTGAEVLIDSSKNMSRGAALVHESRHDVYVIHLVRDGRGYLRSRRRRSGGRFPRPLPFALAPWVFKNLLIGSLLRRGMPPDRYLLVRYEDLAADPDGTLADIGRFVGLDTQDVASAARREGLRRRHLYEPRRQMDYKLVRIDPSRVGHQRATRLTNLAFWISGGFVSSRWGYDRYQRYLERLPG